MDLSTAALALRKVQKIFNPPTATRIAHAQKACKCGTRIYIPRARECLFAPAETSYEGSVCTVTCCITALPTT